MDIMELLKTRRTYRRFKQDPVPDSVVEDILTAARYASSAANKQPLSFVVVKSPEMVKKTFSYTRWAGYLPPEVGQPKEGEEPTLFIGVVENLDINKNCDTDAGLAISNMTLAAWDKGVGSCIGTNGRWCSGIAGSTSGSSNFTASRSKTEACTYRAGTRCADNRGCSPCAGS